MSEQTRKSAPTRNQWSIISQTDQMKYLLDSQQDKLGSIKCSIWVHDTGHSSCIPLHFSTKIEHNEMTLLLYMVSYYYSQVSRNNLANNLCNSSTCTSREQTKIDDHWEKHDLPQFSNSRGEPQIGACCFSLQSTYIWYMLKGSDWLAGNIHRVNKGVKQN